MTHARIARAAASAILFGIGISSAHAADGTITFNGAVTAQTCNIDGNASGSHDFTVTLPTVSAASLATAGEAAGRTPFSIALTGCALQTGAVHTYFESGPTTDVATGNLIVNAGGAGNVEIELLNADGTPIKAGFPDASQNSNPVSLSSDAARLPYYAQYVATGPATAGAANSSVMYTIAYQ